jgi:hypothetical protein
MISFFIVLYFVPAAASSRLYEDVTEIVQELAVAVQATSESSHRYEGVSRSFRTGSLERELQVVQLSATRCSCVTILWVSLVSFADITLCVTSHRVFIVAVVYFVIDSVRKLLDTTSYGLQNFHYWGVGYVIDWVCRTFRTENHSALLFSRLWTLTETKVSQSYYSQRWWKPQLHFQNLSHF